MSDFYDFYDYVEDINLIPGSVDFERYRELVADKWKLYGRDPTKFDAWWRNYANGRELYGEYVCTAADFGYFDRYNEHGFLHTDSSIKRGLRNDHHGGGNPILNVSPYRAVAVQIGGMIYIPLTQVKNKYQHDAFGLDINTPIAIAVPPGADPQDQVDEWFKKKQEPWPDRDSGVGLSEFGWYWRPHGPHDYKNNKKFVKPAMYDAYGNFEYGATGAAYGYSLANLTGAATFVRDLGAHTLASNDPINTQDIKSGYDAIKNGGKLTVFEYDPTKYAEQLKKYTKGGKLVVMNNNPLLPIIYQEIKYVSP